MCNLNSDILMGFWFDWLLVGKSIRLELSLYWQVLTRYSWRIQYMPWNYMQSDWKCSIYLYESSLLSIKRLNILLVSGCQPYFNIYFLTEEARAGSVMINTVSLKWQPRARCMRIIWATGKPTMWSARSLIWIYSPKHEQACIIFGSASVLFMLIEITRFLGSPSETFLVLLKLCHDNVPGKQRQCNAVSSYDQATIWNVRHQLETPKRSVKWCNDVAYSHCLVCQEQKIHRGQRLKHPSQHPTVKCKISKGNCSFLPTCLVTLRFRVSFTITWAHLVAS